MNVGLKDPTGARSGGTTLHHSDALAESGNLCRGQRVDIFADPYRWLCQHGSNAETIAENGLAK